MQWGKFRQATVGCETVAQGDGEHLLYMEYGIVERDDMR